MLTLGLLSVVLVIVFTVLAGGLESQGRAEHVELASSVARETMERIKTQPFLITEGSFDGQVPTPQTSLGFPPDPYPRIKRGPDFFVKVDVEAVDERVWHVAVRVSTADRVMTSMESLLRR